MDDFHASFVIAIPRTISWYSIYLLTPRTQAENLKSTFRNRYRSFNIVPGNIVLVSKNESSECVDDTHSLQSGVYLKILCMNIISSVCNIRTLEMSYSQDYNMFSRHLC